MLAGSYLNLKLTPPRQAPVKSSFFLAKATFGMRVSADDTRTAENKMYNDLDATNCGSEMQMRFDRVALGTRVGYPRPHPRLKALF